MPSWYSSHPPLTWAQTQGLRAKLNFSAVSILHVHSRVCVQWLGRGGGAQIMQSVVLCAANGQDGANAVAQTPCACNYMSRSLPGFSRREGPSAVPTAWVCAAGVQRVRSRPAWRLALTSESRADIARFIEIYPDFVTRRIQQVNTDYEYALRNQMIDSWGINTFDDLHFKYLVDQGKIKGLNNFLMW